MKKRNLFIYFLGILACILIGSFLPFKNIGIIKKAPEALENIPHTIAALQETKIPTIPSYEETLATMVGDKKTFIEVNFSDMKIRHWQDGIQERELPILAVGDPQEWGGTAAGLYSVLSKQPERYSSAADVYMPWAVNFYGKYFLHGEPYYQTGEKRFADATGGCVQSKDEDAKITYDFATVGMPVLVIDKEKEAPVLSPQKPFPILSSESYLVADLNSGTIFAEKNSTQQHEIASITKLMEAIVVSEQINLKSDILVQSFMLGEPYGAAAGLDAGKRFRVVELFYPLLTQSSNDTAKVLSYFLGSIHTIELMNQKTASLLMEHTTYTDASGYDPGNISTAQDLFKLLRYITINRSPILSITKGSTNQVNTYGPIRFYNLENKNLFADHPAFVGGKTGYIKTSGYTGAFIFEVPIKNQTRKVAIILLNAPHQKGPQSLYQDVVSVLSWFGTNPPNLPQQTTYTE